MKYLLFVLVSISVVSCCGSRVPQASQNEPALNDVVTAIQHQYTTALKRLKDSGITDIKISEADLSLAVTGVISANASVKVLIFTPSKKFIRTKTTTITYVLSEAKDAKGGAGIKLADNRLSDIIVSTARNFHDLNQTIGDLTKDSFSIDLVFSIENDTSLGLSFDIIGLSVDAGAEFDKTVTHELKLTFTPVK